MMIDCAVMLAGYFMRLSWNRRSGLARDPAFLNSFWLGIIYPPPASPRELAWVHEYRPGKAVWEKMEELININIIYIN